MNKKKLTTKQLRDLLRKKTCSTPHNLYIAKELFEDENHPIAKGDALDFQLRDIFDHIVIEDDTTPTTTP